MVNPYPPGATGTTVHHAGADAPGRGTWWGVGVILVAVCVATWFGVSTNSGDDVPRAVVATQALRAQGGAPPSRPDGAPVAQAFGVAFPDLAARRGWRAVARRSDDVGGRHVETVVYGREGRRMAYSVVGGPPLSVPAGGRLVDGRTPTVVAFDSDGRQAVMTTRKGHTVVLSAVGVDRAALVRAARTMPADG